MGLRRRCAGIPGRLRDPGRVLRQHCTGCGAPTRAVRRPGCAVLLPLVEGSRERNHDPKRTCRLPGLASRLHVIAMHEGAIGTLGFNS